jgi:hypothetical protein
VETNIAGVAYRVAFGVLERLDQPPSGELRPAFEDSIGSFKSLRGFYQITSPRLTQVASDDFLVNLPRLQDRNGNGVADFYEVQEAVDEVATPNTFEAPNGGGTVEAAWQRPAGSALGVVSMHLVSPGLNSLDATFRIPFQILEYSGPLDYLPGDADVAGAVQMTRAGASNAALSGQLNLTKLDADFLAVVPGAWLNSAGRKVSFRPYISDTNQPAILGRSGPYYEGLVTFDEGSLGRGDTVVYDILGNVQPVVWDLLIADPNDFDGNGIPDLSDPNYPVVVSPPPVLGVSIRGGRIELSLAGQAGRTYVIEAAKDLGGNAWTTAASVTVASGGQTVEIPLPALDLAFWRARAIP